MAHILLLDNSPNVTSSAEGILRKGGYHITKCSTFAAGIEEARTLPRNTVILAAYRIGDTCVSEFIKDIRDLRVHHPVIAYAAVLNGGDVRDAMRDSKAVDFLQPQTFDENLLHTVAKHMPTTGTDDHSAMYQQKGTPAEELHQKIRQISKYNENTLIVGGTGTGKGRVAVSLHMQSDMASKPLVILEHHEIEMGKACNVACPLCLIKQKFEEADGGTIIIKNIHLFCKQGRLLILSLMKDPRINVNVITTADHSIYDMINAGTFDMELMSNIAETKLLIGDFRDNPENIEFLAALVLTTFCQTYNREQITISPLAFAMLLAYSYPGNEAEFESIIRQSAAICKGNIILATDLPPKIHFAYKRLLREHPIDLTNQDVIQDAIDKTSTYEEAAELLNISLRGLFDIRMSMPGLKKPKRKRSKSQN